MRRASRSLARGEVVDAEALRDEVADLHAGVERADRVLEDDLHVLSHLLHPFGRERDEVDAVELDLAGGGLEEPEDRPPEGRLAAAGLADEADRLAAPDIEVDAVDGLPLARGALEEPLLDGEVLLEAADAEQDVVVGGRFRNGPVDGSLGALGAHEAIPIGLVARGPSSHSQHADSCAPTGRSGGSSVRQRSKT